MHIHLEDLFNRDPRSMRVEVGDLDRGSLFEQGFLLQIGRNETSSTLVGVLLDEIARDGARLVEGKAIIVLEMAMVSALAPNWDWLTARCREPGRMAGT